MKKPSKTANEYKNLEKSLGIPKFKPLEHEKAEKNEKKEHKSKGKC
jgi:hypothetical protein